MIAHCTTTEESATALTATTPQDFLIVVSAFQPSCRHYTTGNIAALAFRNLQSIPDPLNPDYSILWTMGHVPADGNGVAHAAASKPFPVTACRRPAVPQRYEDIIEHYRL